MTFPFLKEQRSWIWLFCIVILAVRIGGAHLHLCFDGSEQPLSVHAGELNTHDEHGGIHHADADLNLVDSGVAKTLTQVLSAPALIAAIIVLCSSIVERSSPSPSYRPPLFQFIPHRFTAPRAPPR